MNVKSGQSWSLILTQWVDDEVNVSVPAGGATLDSFWSFFSEVGDEKMERRTAAQQKTHPSLTWVIYFQIREISML